MTTRHAPWLVAALVWLAGVCMYSIVPLAGLQFAGTEHFASSTGSRELHDFVKNSLLYPGLVLPLVLLWKPAWSVVVCGLLLVGYAAVVAFAVSHIHALWAYPVFWVGTVSPFVLLGLATFLAFRRRDWSTVKDVSV